jgi:kynurenine formamidase
MPASSTDGLRFYNLSHRVGHNMVQWPSPFSKPFVSNRLYYHSMHDFYAVEYDGIMHRGTHMDTPAHVLPDQPFLDGFDVSRFFGTGVAVSIPKGRWGVITPEDLEKADPEIRPNDIVMINTGAHHLFGDNDDYFAYSPGLYTEAAQWLVDKGVKLVGIDVQALDHPLGTRMAEHGPGPIMPRGERRLPGLGARAQGHADRGHPRHREHRRRPGRGDRQAVHVHGLPVAVPAGRRLPDPGGRGHRPGPDVPHPGRDGVRCPATSCATRCPCST